MEKCVFLDRDGVLNVELNDYLYKPEDLIVPDGVPEALRLLKNQGYLLIVITNQAGIARGLYSPEDVYAIHQEIQKACGDLLDDLYFSPHHPKYSTESLTRKPDSLLIEKALAKYNIDPHVSWMVGDRERDIQAGLKAGVQTVHIVNGNETPVGRFSAGNLLEAARIILDQVD